jgi:ribosomal-protein-alanine N-acetyltransferase
LNRENKFVLTTDRLMLIGRFEEDAIRFSIVEIGDPNNRIIGTCNFTQIFRGPFQDCYIGYQINANFEGKGLMSESVSRAIRYMFQEQNLHRIMANYMPMNVRSKRLLQKLEFVIEGEAKNYLQINGKWEDHILTSLTNPNWHQINDSS